MKLAVFDYDSTLMDGETLELLVSDNQIKKEIKAVTDRAMAGELDFFESLTYRVNFLKGMKVEEVDDICHNLPYNKGAKEVVSGLKARGFKVVCFSGGFRNATSYAKNLLGLDGEFSNILHSKNGVLTGQVGGSMMFNDSKGIMLQNLQSILGVSQENTLVVGDGANDLSMFKYAGMKVAFCGKEVLKKAADITIDKKDLSLILDEVDCFR